MTAALVLAGLFYWTVVAVLQAAAVAPQAWTMLFGVCVAGALLCPARTVLALSPGAWLYGAFCASLLAAFFFGANLGLDALHGANRPKAHVAATLGGLELWCVLCPGLSSLAIALATRRWLPGRTGRSAAAGTFTSDTPAPQLTAQAEKAREDQHVGHPQGPRPADATGGA